MEIPNLADQQHIEEQLVEQQIPLQLEELPQSGHTTAVSQSPPFPKQRQHIYVHSTVSDNEKELFYKLMYPLQFYVAQKLSMKFDIEITSVEDFKDKLTLQDKLSVRDAMYENLQLLDDFVNENPFNMLPEELMIVTNWKQHHLSGTFVIERHLQKGSIFILSNQLQQSQELQLTRVYLVHGLETPVVQMIPKYMLPQCVMCVLLPFKGKIVYDGLLKALPMNFGYSLTNSFREIYMRAKQQECIITSLDSEHSDMVTSDGVNIDGKKKRKRKDDGKGFEEGVEDVKKLCSEIVRSTQLLKNACPKGVEKSACTVLFAAAQMVQKILDDPKDIVQVQKSIKALKTSLSRL
jgi:hypothetical protein